MLNGNFARLVSTNSIFLWYKAWLVMLWIALNLRQTVEVLLAGVKAGEVKCLVAEDLRVKYLSLAAQEDKMRRTLDNAIGIVDGANHHLMIMTFLCHWHQLCGGDAGWNRQFKHPITRKLCAQARPYAK